MFGRTVRDEPGGMSSSSSSYASTALHPPRIVVAKPIVPSHSVIEDDAERAHYWAQLLRAWRVTGARRIASRTYFPCCNPLSLSRARLPELGRAPYRICAKSDGVRYALLLTTRPGDDPYAAVALMVDRSRVMHEVEVVAPADYFVKGTLLEGELVWRQPHERQLLYLVFDALLVKGESLLDYPFDERLAAATRCTRWSEDIAVADDPEARALETDSIALVHFDPNLAMRPKRFVDCEHSPRLWHERNDLEHLVDGLIIQRADAPYVLGTAEDGSCFKWKEHCTVDLRGAPDVQLHCADVPLPHVLCDGRVVEVAPSRVVGTEDTVVEYHVTCAVDRIRLFAVRHRTDKATPNGLRVVVATVRDVIDDVRPDDLASNCLSLRRTGASGDNTDA
jgi:hypothetical protein